MPTNSKGYAPRLDLLYIRKLESLSIFDQIMHKLVSGQSPITVAKWCHDQKVPGEVCGIWTWRKRIEALARRVKAQIKKVEPTTVATVTRHAVQQVLPGAKKDKEFSMLDAIDLIAKLDVSLQEAIGKISAERILKTAYVIQHSRVKQMVDMETRIGMPFSWGHQNLEVLNKIGESVRKLEVGISYMQSNGRGPYPGGLLPHDPQPQQPQPFGDLLEGLDEVDRNLIRAASIKVIEIMNEEVNIGQSAHAEAEADVETVEQKIKQ